MTSIYDGRATFAQPDNEGVKGGAGGGVKRGRAGMRKRTDEQTNEQTKKWPSLSPENIVT
jgi:hypothetical protein